MKILLHGISEIFLPMYSCRTFFGVVTYTMRYYFKPIRMAIINKSTNKCWQGCGEKGTLVHCWWVYRLVQPLWKIVWNFLKKLKMELSFHPAIPLPRLYPKKTESLIQKNLCSSTIYNSQVLEIMLSAHQ